MNNENTHENKQYDVPAMVGKQLIRSNVLRKLFSPSKHLYFGPCSCIEKKPSRKQQSGVDQLPNQHKKSHRWLTFLKHLDNFVEILQTCRVFLQSTQVCAN
jgi:hypothetical protein